MALGALIAAYQEAEGGDSLRATLPLAGRTLLEYQARLAAAAGARPIVVLVERMPPALAMAIDRVRSEGIGLQVARDVDEAAAIFGPSETVLLLADGLFADRDAIERVARATAPALLTVPDNIGLDAFERLDAATRWGGAALLKGADLHDTAEGLGDWDVQSTLLRSLDQDGALRIVAAEGAPPLMAVRGSDLRDAERRLLHANRRVRGSGPVARFVTPFVENTLVERLLPTPAEPRSLLLAALALLALATLFFAKSWLGAGLVTLLLATPLDRIAERLAALRMQPLRLGDALRAALAPAAAASFVALAARLATDGGGWGCYAAVAAGLAFHILADREAEALRGALPWRATWRTAAWGLLPFALTGFWRTGLVVLAVHAAASAFALQSRRLSQKPD